MDQHNYESEPLGTFQLVSRQAAADLFWAVVAFALIFYPVLA